MSKMNMVHICLVEQAGVHPVLTCDTTTGVSRDIYSQNWDRENIFWTMFYLLWDAANAQGLTKLLLKSEQGFKQEKGSEKPNLF